MSESIYTISNEISAFLKQAEDENWDDQTIADTLLGLEVPLEQKVDNYLMVIANKEAIEKALIEESKLLAERAKIYTNHSKRMKTTLLSMLQQLDKSNLQSPRGTIAKVKGRVSVEFAEADLHDDLFSWDYIKSVNKAEIKKRLEDGETVTGAWLKTGPETISIRRK